MQWSKIERRPYPKSSSQFRVDPPGRPESAARSAHSSTQRGATELQKARERTVAEGPPAAPNSDAFPRGDPPPHRLPYLELP
eukprot:COSAG02_NODE_9983_length_2057_cov_85.281410_2_plen_82_part_00